MSESSYYSDYSENSEPEKPEKQEKQEKAIKTAAKKLVKPATKAATRSAAALISMGDDSKIHSFSEIDQIKSRQGMYVGVSEEHTEDMQILKPTEIGGPLHMEYKSCTYSASSQKLFDEIVQNALDNYINSECPKGYYVKVRASARSFSVENNGRLFDLKNETACLDKIDSVFSVPNTSSHYEGNDASAGMNGIGCKAVNIFSKLFKIELCVNGLFYTSTWRNMMSEHARSIVKMPGSAEYLRVTVELIDMDTEVEIQHIKRKYTFFDLNPDLIHKYLFDCELINFGANQLHIYFNNTLVFNHTTTLKEYLNVYNIYDYKMEFFSNDKSLEGKGYTVLMFDPRPAPASKPVNKEAKKETLSPPTDNLSFLNWISCRSGAQFEEVRKLIKDQLGVKGVLKIGILIFGFMKKVDYSDEVKSEVKTKIPTAEVPVFNKQMEDFVTQILSNKTLTFKHNFSKKLTPANNARLKNSDCTLIVTEGDSAACIFSTIAEHKAGFFNDFGVLPLKGKIKNVSKYDTAFEVENEEIMQIIEIVGLQRFKTYETKEEVNTLWYKHILIATDYDQDGFHIKGLLINFFLRFWPGLLHNDFMREFITPLIIAKKGGISTEFYNYNEFLVQRELEHFTEIEYFKGLGTFDDVQKIEIAGNLKKHIKQMVSRKRERDEDDSYYENSDSYYSDSENSSNNDYVEMMNKLFKESAQKRKDLINNFQEQFIDHSVDFVNVDDILEQQVVAYSVSTLERAIPDFIDGLKESERKIIYISMLRAFNAEKQKVATLAAGVSEKTDYHHGETSLEEAIVNLAQDFPGSNNCNLLVPVGSFGTRFDPKHASARYIYTKGSEWLYKLFNKQDANLYVYQKSDDNEDIEPERLFPILPLELLNGCRGVATGYSTFVPSFDIVDIKKYVIDILEGRTGGIFNIYYKGYLGVTKLMLGEDGQQVFVNTGAYTLTAAELVVKDVVLDTNLKKFTDYLKDKEIVSEIINKLEVKVKIGGKLTPDILEEIKNKFLYYQERLTNMTFKTVSSDTVLNATGERIEPTPLIRQFSNVYTFLKEWISERLTIYQKRRIWLLEDLIIQYIIHFGYVKFIRLDLGKLVKKEKEKELHAALVCFAQESDFEKIAHECVGMGKKFTFEFLDEKLDKIENGSYIEKEFNYLMCKQMRFYEKYTDYTSDIREQFEELFKKTAEKLWIADLELI